jgi:hypothetical protein
VAKRPSTPSIRSRQKGILRYIVSTDIDTAARDFGVSTDAIKRFVGAGPKTVQKSDRFNKLVDVDPVEIAKGKQIKLVQRLSGKRLAKAYGQYYGKPRLTKAVRLAQATREKRRIEVDGKIIYKPVAQTKSKVARKQILNNLAGMTSASIMDQFNQGTLKESEARAMLNTLWKNSDATGAMEYFDDHTE